MKSIEKANAVRDEQSAVAWFYRMLRNAVIDHHRRAGVRSKAAEAFAREMEGAVQPPDEIREEICGCIVRLSETLKPEYADALRRIDVDGVSVASYTSEAGISPSNAGVRVFRAREALRKQVKASCGTCAEHGCTDCRCQ